MTRALSQIQLQKHRQGLMVYGRFDGKTEGQLGGTAPSNTVYLPPYTSQFLSELPLQTTGSPSLQSLLWPNKASCKPPGNDSSLPNYHCQHYLLMVQMGSQTVSKQLGRLSVSLQIHNTLGSGNDNTHTYFTDEKAKAQRGAGTKTGVSPLNLGKSVNLASTGQRWGSVNTHLHRNELAKASTRHPFH